MIRGSELARGTSTGGWLVIRYCPSTSSPSLDRACRLSRVRAFSRFRSDRLISLASCSCFFVSFFASFFSALPFALPVARVSAAVASEIFAVSSSSSRWAYQMSKVRIDANSAMALE